MTTIWIWCGWILIPNETSDKTPSGFPLIWKMFFIWDQTLAIEFYWDVLLINTSHGNDAIPSRSQRENPQNEVVQSENMSLHNFLLFHLRRYMAYGLVFSSVSRCLEPCGEALALRFWHLQMSNSSFAKFKSIWNSFFDFPSLTSH